MSEELGSPSENPDVQEALSLRYVVGVRLALLESGKIAVFDRDGLKLVIELCIEKELADFWNNYLYELLEKDRDRIMEYTPAEPEPKPLATSKSAEDLGL